MRQLLLPRRWEELIAMPRRAELHGRGKVQLFDARTKKLVHEERVHNYITDVETLQAEHKYRTAFNGSFPGVNSDTAPSDVMQHFFVTDNDDAEDTTVNVPVGNIIAWSNKSLYVGSDTKRGSPNSVESIMTPTTVTWVFDWPTTAGNGTFRDLNWGILETATANKPRLSRAAATPWTNLNASGDVSGAVPFGMTVESINAAGDASSIVYWMGMNADNWGVTRLTGLPNASAMNAGFMAGYAASIMLTGCAWDGTGTPGVWVVSPESTTIKKISTAGAVLTTITGPATTGYNDIHFDGTHLWVTAVSDNKVYQLTTAGVTVSSWTPSNAEHATPYWGITKDTHLTQDVWMVAVSKNGPSIFRYGPSGEVRGEYFAGYFSGAPGSVVAHALVWAYPASSYPQLITEPDREVPSTI